ncbi:AMP-binding protein [Ruminococcus flavefaciens]|uniref:AMP-binding protein n=1 Tax=Ruminococcus flavefaciens TaxID=1265 RepID=UPI00048DE5E7|nr:AMP-binding protein [Ruminococcus flavefaciens]
MALNVYKNCNYINLVSFLKKAVELYGDSPVALIKEDDGVRQISYNEFYGEVVRGAAEIVSTIGKGNNIALCGKFDYSFMLSFFQIIFSENIVVSLDIQQSDDIIRKSIVNADIHYYLSDLNDDNALADSAEKICLNGSAHEHSAENDMEKEITPDSTAIIIFTSGTEGDPKAVALSHENILSNIFYSMKIVGLDNFSTEDHIVSVLPAFHMFQLVTGFLTPLAFGVANCFASKEAELLKCFRLFQPKVLIAVPEVLKSFRKLIAGGLKGNPVLLLGAKLKSIVCGGAFCPVDVLKWYDSIGINVHYGYGITECSPVISCSLPTQEIDGSVGIPDSEYCTVSISEDNEILVKGQGVFKGYWNKTELANYNSPDGWYHTGDIGYLDENGKLFISGRKKNVLVLESGNNVVPEELEKEAEKSEYVIEALVYIHASHQSEMLGCDVVMNERFYEELSGKQQEEAVENIKRKINNEQPKYKNIAVIRCVKEPFIRNKVGKILRYNYVTERGRLIEENE